MNIGAGGRNRTRDPLITSESLILVMAREIAVFLLRKYQISHPLQALILLGRHLVCGAEISALALLYHPSGLAHSALSS